MNISAKRKHTTPSPSIFPLLPETLLTDGAQAMSRRVVQDQNSWFLNVTAKIIDRTNQEIRVDIGFTLVSYAKVIRAKNAKQVDFLISHGKDLYPFSWRRPAIGQFGIHRKRAFITKIQIKGSTAIELPQLS